MKDRKHCCGRCLRGTRDIFDFNVHKDVQFLAVATFSDVAEGMRHGVFQVRVVHCESFARETDFFQQKFEVHVSLPLLFIVDNRFAEV